MNRCIRNFVFTILLVSSSFAAGEWTTGANLPVSKQSQTLDLANGLFYQYGGENGSNTASNELAVYNPISNAWTNLTSSTAAARWGHASTYCNGKIYYIGGLSSGGTYKDVFAFDPNDIDGSNPYGQWDSTSYPDIGTQLHDGTAVCHNNTVYYFGGLNGGPAQNAFYSLDTTNPNSWSTISNSVDGRRGHAMVLIDGKIYLVGGTEGTSGAAIVDHVDIYDISGNSWSTGADMATDAYQVCGISYDDKVVIFGGFNTAFVAKVQVYDPAGDSWSESLYPENDTAKFDVGCEVSGQKMYVAGGWNGSLLDDLDVLTFTSSPGSVGSPNHIPKFDDNGDLVNSVIVENAGKIGVGTSTPDQALEVNGGIKIGDVATGTEGTIRYDGTFNTFEGYDGSDWITLGTSSGYWTQNGESDLYMAAGGVGIHELDPEARLEVVGPSGSPSVANATIIVKSQRDATLPNYDPIMALGSSSKAMTPDDQGTVWIAADSKDGSEGANIALMPNNGNIGLKTHRPFMDVQLKFTGGWQIDELDHIAFNYNMYEDGSDDRYIVNQNKAATLRLSNGAFRFFNTDTASTNYFSVINDLTERMVLDTEGNLGIGLSNPTHRLTVRAGTATDGIRFENSSGDLRYFADLSSDNMQMGLYDSSDALNTIIRASGPSVFLGGNVGVGVSSPSEELEVSGTIKTDVIETDSVDFSSNSTSSITCDSSTEGKMVYSVASGEGSVSACVITGGSSYTWKKLKFE